VNAIKVLVLGTLALTATQACKRNDPEPVPGPKAGVAAAFRPSRIAWFQGSLEEAFAPVADPKTDRRTDLRVCVGTGLPPTPPSVSVVGQHFLATVGGNAMGFALPSGAKGGARDEVQSGSVFDEAAGVGPDMAAGMQSGLDLVVPADVRTGPEIGVATGMRSRPSLDKRAVAAAGAGVAATVHIDAATALGPTGVQTRLRTDVQRAMPSVPAADASAANARPDVQATEARRPAIR